MLIDETQNCTQFKCLSTRMVGLGMLATKQLAYQMAKPIHEQFGVNGIILLQRINDNGCAHSDGSSN